MTEGFEKPILLESLGMIFPKPNSKQKRRYGIYQCQYCFTSFKARTSHVEKGLIITCGCRECFKQHDESNTKLYLVWQGIKDRCLNKNSNAYKDYGGRGISIHDDWVDNYKAFSTWSYSHGYKEGCKLTIDRIDVDGNYSPDNCRYVTWDIQARNKRLLSKANTSGYRGVHWRADRNKWYVRITVDYKNINLGSFNTVEEGVVAYNNYVIENNLEHPLNIIL